MSDTKQDLCELLSEEREKVNKAIQTLENIQRHIKRGIAPMPELSIIYRMARDTEKEIKHD